MATTVHQSPEAPSQTIRPEAVGSHCRKLALVAGRLRLPRNGTTHRLPDKCGGPRWPTRWRWRACQRARIPRPGREGHRDFEVRVVVDQADLLGTLENRTNAPSARRNNSGSVTPQHIRCSTLLEHRAN